MSAMSSQLAINSFGAEALLLGDLARTPLRCRSCVPSNKGTSLWRNVSTRGRNNCLTDGPASVLAVTALSGFVGRRARKRIWLSLRQPALSNVAALPPLPPLPDCVQGEAKPIRNTGIRNSTARSVLLQGGVFAVDKPKGCTSADIVSRVKQALARIVGAKAAKAGHGGTLDPEATGVLIIGVGQGTRMLQGFLDGRKAYDASVTLGVETDTLDASGKVVAEAPFSIVTRATIEELLPRFRGAIQQVPPMFSALKKNGQRLYKLAHAGVEVEREAREVLVHQLDLTSFELPQFSFSVECGKGLYVRSLGADIARAAGTVGHVSSLRRTGAGAFGLPDCLSIDEVSDDARVLVGKLQKAPVPAGPSGRQRFLARRAQQEQRQRPKEALPAKQQQAPLGFVSKQPRSPSHSLSEQPRSPSHGVADQAQARSPSHGVSEMQQQQQTQSTDQACAELRKLLLAL